MLRRVLKNIVVDGETLRPEIWHDAYPNGRMAVVAFDQYGEEYGRWSVNVPEIELGTHEFIVSNDLGEAFEGALGQLPEVAATGKIVDYGFVRGRPVMKVAPLELEEWLSLTSTPSQPGPEMEQALLLYRRYLGTEENQPGVFDPRKYYVTWRVEHHPHGLTRAEVEALGPGISAGHGLFTQSVILPPDGSYSLHIMSYDGRAEDGRQYEPSEWFKLWAMLTMQLSRHTSLPVAKRSVLLKTAALIRQVIFGQPPAEVGEG